MSEAATPSQPSASGGLMHPFEAILRMCAAAAPKPWYPRAYAQKVGMSQERLYAYLEELWLDGLVQKVEGTPETGPGLTLTPVGRDVLDDAAALQRLKEGRAVVEGSQGGIVREAIRRPARPIVTQALLAMNVAVFGYGLLLAYASGAVPAYLGGGDLPILEKLGGIRGDYWAQGEWWRLAASCFIHIGILHILFNMIALYRIGADAERMWGRLRYLVIYAFAGLGGSCLAVAMQPEVLMAGASGALCGVIAAVAVWVLCNGRHLPRSLASRMRVNLLINGVLIAFISIIPGVSGWGHLGGALTGAAVALVLQAQRFGPSPWRWAVLAALVPLPWAAYALIEHERAVNPAWAGANQQGGDKRGAERSKEQETKDFTKNYLKRIRLTTRAALEAYRDGEALLRKTPADRDDHQLTKVKQALHAQQQDVQQLADDLSREGPYQDEDTEEARATAAQYAAALADLLGLTQSHLRVQAPWDPEDEKALKKVEDLRDAWSKLVTNP